MKKRFVICLCGFLVSTYISGCKIGDTEYVLDTNISQGRHVFSVNEEECSQKEARLYLSNYRNLYGKEYGVDLWNYEFEGESLEEYIKGATLEELTKIVCMNAVAKEQGLELSDKEISCAKDAAKEYYSSLSSEDKKYINASIGELTDFYVKYATAEKLYGQLTEGVNEEVSDDEARVMRVQQIITSDKKVADEIKAHLNAGEDFAYIANTYSEAGVVETNISRDDYPKAVEEKVFELENNQISEMILVDENYYIIKCVNKFDQELTEANKANILVKREKEKFNDVYGDYVENGQFELNEEVWDSMTIAGHTEVTTDSFFEIYQKHF